jgi:hypothetical protein
MYESMFKTVAAGFVADELPQNLVEKFLAKIESRYDEVYAGISSQDGTTELPGFDNMNK